MKKLILLSCMLLVTALTSCQKQTDFPMLTGPYLGQNPPGKTPEVFASGIISTGKNENYLIVTPDGNEVLFMDVVNKNGQGFATIYHTKLENDNWTTPKIAPFSGIYCDGYTSIHPNGSKLYFQSNRPISLEESIFEWNIWYVDNVGESWGEPKSIGRPINGNYNTSGPSVTNNGTMYFTIITSDWANKIYRSEYKNGVYQEPELLPENINSSHQQFDSYVAPDESYLIYGAYQRPDSYGGTDLYISFRDETGNWSESVNMGPTINSTRDEGSATITSDMKYIFYSKYNNTTRSMDIYWFSTEFLEELMPKE